MTTATVEIPCPGCGELITIIGSHDPGGLGIRPRWSWQGDCLEGHLEGLGPIEADCFDEMVSEELTAAARGF